MAHTAIESVSGKSAQKQTLRIIFFLLHRECVFIVFFFDQIVNMFCRLSQFFTQFSS